MKHLSVLSLITAIVISLILGSCKEDKLEIQQAYEFTLTHMPIPTEVEKNETVEIPCNLVSEGNYQEAKYTIRYFQNQGVGNLAFANQKPFEPNDTYALQQKEFYLYYTALSGGQHQFDVYVEDNFGQMQKVSFEFDVKEE